MRSHSTLIGTTLAAIGSVTCAPISADTSAVRVAVDSDGRTPVAQALMLAASQSPNIVTIDGKDWRKAPVGAAGATGRAGTRIILDGDLWLLAEDPAFARTEAAGGSATRTRSSDVAPASKASTRRSRQAAVAPVPVVETPEQLRIRQRRLMAESRRRQAEQADRLAAGRAAERAAERAAAREEERAAEREKVLERVRARQRDAAEEAGEAEPTSRLENRGEDRRVADAPSELRIRQRQLLREARRRQADSEAAAEARATERAAVRARVRDAADQERDAELVARLDRTQADRELAEAAARDSAAADLVAEQAAGEAAFVQTATVSALRLPGGEPNSGDTFSYVQLMPISYDIGGAGVMLEGSTSVRERMHVLLRTSIADRYQEVLIGAGVHYTPPTADRLTLLLNAGYEYSVFPLEDDVTGLQIDDASGGPFLTASGRLVLNPRFMVEGGVGYSSFHEGDPIGFGSGFFHVNDVLDLMSRIELGDQDSYGVGIRVNY